MKQAVIGLVVIDNDNSLMGNMVLKNVDSKSSACMKTAGQFPNVPKFPIAPSIPMGRPNQVHTFHIYLHLKLFLTQKLLQIYTANHATFPIQIRKITEQICGDFLGHPVETVSNDSYHISVTK